MAIYRLGTASLAANGVVIGVGTKWQDKLSLIRVGATILFPKSPGAIGTISAIVSDTELRVMTTNGAVVPAGSDYIILLHDSITVEGLAQDVAETLRYYQSKETEIAGAIDFFETFDWEAFKVMVDKVAADKASAEASKNAAKVSETNAKASETKAKTSETNAKTSETASSGSAAAAKTSETNAKASETAANGSKNAAATSATNAKTSETNAKTSETNAKASETAANASKNAAATSATAAAGSATNAKTSETNAKASENAANASKNAAATSATNAKTSEKNAKTSEINAEEWAKSVNAENLLTKSGNLAGLTDKAQAWLNVRPVGATTLAADPVGDYDATTKRWVNNIIDTGEVGPKWSVIDGDASMPPNNTAITGGVISSEYKVGTSVEGSATIKLVGTTNVSYAARISVFNKTLGKNLNMDLSDEGTLNLPAPGRLASASNQVSFGVDEVFTRNLTAAEGSKIKVSATEQNEIAFWNQNGASGQYVNQIRGNWYAGSWTLGGVRGDSTGLSRAQLNVSSGSGGLNASYIFGANGTATAQQWTSTSDIRVKENVERIADPLIKMRTIKGVSWKLKTNGSIGHGFVAQDVENSFPGAVIETYDMEMGDGEVVENVKAVDTSGVAAALHHEAILALMDQIDELKREVELLKNK